jgi:hypothetical protein
LAFIIAGQPLSGFQLETVFHKVAHGALNQRPVDLRMVNFFAGTSGRNLKRPDPPKGLSQMSSRELYAK